MLCPRVLRRNLSAQINPAIGRFASSETGSMTIFTLFIFIVMLMITGLAVDLMRFETKRVALQSTLDRAVLAAADMDQSMAASVVVQEYFDKAGLQGVTVKTHEEKDATFRSVEAMGAMSMDTLFMQLLGIHELEAPAIGGAYEGMSEVEISLVLDVSGSMGSNNRLPNLKVAAKEFVNTVIDASADSSSQDQTHITIVPFSTQVNASATIAGYMNYSGEHSHSYCVDWGTDDFASMAISLTDEVRQTGHFDPRNRALATESRYQPVCYTEASRQILPFENDIPTLENFIDSMFASGWTSIELGAKWGTAFLDPSTRQIAAGMAANGEINAAFDVRPLDYNARNLIKVMIVMSDGANTNQWYLNDAFQSGPSALFYHAADDVWTYYDENNDYTNSTTHKYWYEDPDDGDTWSEYPYGYDAGTFNNTVLPLTWPEVWERAGVDWIREYVIEDMTNSDAASQQWESTVYTLINRGLKDTRTSAICAQARAKGITVYAIGFETDAAGDAALLDCATSASHFYNATGTQISDVFASIAADITQLKLTY